MRITPTAAAVPLLLILLTWLSIRAVNTDAERFDRALATLDRFAMTENALSRDVLSVRAGILRNYDPLVREINMLRDSLRRLRDIAPADADTTAAIDALIASVDRREALVEQFKSDNALLQNSLAYFEFFSTLLGAPGGNGPLASAVSSLAAAMLRLTLDTSAPTTDEVEARLNEVVRLSDETRDIGATKGLVTHGRLLHDLLPKTDDGLRSLLATVSRQEEAVLRAIILARQFASRETARMFRFLLYATSLFLVGFLIHSGIRLRRRTLALRQRAAFEHVIAGISTAFIDAPPDEIGGHIERALARLAERVGADRAYVVLAGSRDRLHAWCRAGIAYPPGWPEQALGLAAHFPLHEGLVHVRSVERLPPGPDRRALAAAGLHSWIGVPSAEENGARSVLGFDRLGRRHSKPYGEPDLLRLALDAITNAVRREMLERERMRLEMRLQQARRMETLGTLASGVAHNFSNIIGAILGHVEMADEQLAAGSRTAGNTEAIRQAAERARELVDQILAFSRRRDTNRQAVNVRALITEAADLLHASLPPPIELQVREAPDAAMVSGQYVQLQQVILNLCNNAAQAMDESGCIEIAAAVAGVASPRTLSQGRVTRGRYVRIVVSDTGRGMTEALLERIFEPFFTTRAAGYGLGLATVREIVREHGGAINVTSKVGEGSRFEVWLPCIASSEAIPRESEPMSQLGRGETLLVVDDDRQRLLAIEDMLAALGYEPVGFLRAADALAACRATPKRFDALIVGHPMIEMPALALASALHEIAPRLPMLLTTAAAEEIAVDALAAAGIAEIVHRPLIASDIAAVLSACLAERENSRRVMTMDTQLR